MTAAEPEPRSAEVEDAADGDEFVTAILARRRRRTPILTLALLVLAAAAVAFVLGIEAQKHWGTSSTTGSAANARSAFAALRGGTAATRGAAARGAAGAGGFPAFGGVGAGAGGGTAGTVTLIKGTSLYVTDATGNTVLVHTSPGSTITKTVSGTIRSIVPGDAVAVRGTQAANGSYAATSISIEAAGGSSNG